MLTVIGKTVSINVRKVLWTCAELDLPFAHEEWKPEYVALNPNAMVPVIRDGDFVLWESNTICRYLCTRHERGDLLPVTPQARALVEKWMDWQATELNNAWRYAFMALVRNSPAHADPALIAASIASWNKHIAMLDAHLATQPYAAGEGFTLADVVLGLSVNRWAMAPMERPHLPHVMAYYERLSARPGYLKYGRNGMP